MINNAIPSGFLRGPLKNRLVHYMQKTVGLGITRQEKQDQHNLPLEFVCFQKGVS